MRRWILENDLLSWSLLLQPLRLSQLLDHRCPSGEKSSLGVTLDSQLRFYITPEWSTRHAPTTHMLYVNVRHVLTPELALTVACSIVATRIDYCNSILYGAPAATFSALQHVQNILARVVTRSARRSSAKPLLESLHWLPVRQRVTYKLATVCYKARSTSTPVYLQSQLVPHIPSRPLLSSHTPRLAVSRTLTVFASSAFSVDAAAIWNSLPDNVVNLDTLATFNKRLKTHLFHCVMWNFLANEHLCISYYCAIKFYYCIVLYCIQS